MPTNDCHLVVVCVDRLNAGLLGPYGNTAMPTRALNRLAGESRLAEFLLTTSGDLAANYRSLWRGEHPLAPHSPGRSLIETWRDAGRHTLLVTDDETVAALPEAAHFAERIDVRVPTFNPAAASTAETQCAQVFAAAIERLADLRPPFALWLHAKAMSGPWDAPAEIREHLRDEEDPPAATFVTPPVLRLPKGYDPDALLPISQAYAAQVLVVDECVEAMTDALAEAGLADNTLLVVTSPRGYLLGQQRHVGQDVLLEDLLHVPLFVRYPHAAHAAQRELGLWELRDVHALLEHAGEWNTTARDRIVMQHERERALRTLAWHLRITFDDDSEEPRRELYAKPDDRYEVNEVASRSQSVIEKLEAVADATAAAIGAQCENELAPLAEELLDTLR